jgi:hypothetical protein
VKPGYKSTELLLAVAVIVLTSIGTIPHDQGGRAAAIAVGYAVARGLAKLGYNLLAADPGFDLGALPDPTVTHVSPKAPSPPGPVSDSTPVEGPAPPVA